MDRLHALAKRFRKPLTFGLLAGAGCLAGAIAAELIVHGMLKPEKRQVDVLFVLDVTGSMQPAIDGVARGISDFTQTLTKGDVDARVGLVAFRDVIGKNDDGSPKPAEEPQVLQFSGQPFTDQAQAFRAQTEKLIARGGGDPPESSLDALALAAKQPFRPGATKVVLLITDVPPHVPDRDMKSVAEATERLRAAGIQQFHLATPAAVRDFYADIAGKIPGEFFEISMRRDERVGFDRVLPEVSERIATAIGTGGVAKGQMGTAVFAVVLWTALIAIGAALALIIAQNRSLRRPLLTGRQALLAVAGGLAGGLIAGSVSQLSVLLFTGGPVLTFLSRLLAWAALGGLLGLAMAFVVPNLKKAMGAAGGAAGGIVAAIVFTVLAFLLGDTLGRLVGAAILGLFIGVMIAMVEAFVRNAWLIVHWAPREESTVSLGERPVLIGSGSDVHIPLRKDQGFPPITATVSLAAGRVELENKINGQKSVLTNGNKVVLGSLTIEVRTAT